MHYYSNPNCKKVFLDEHGEKPDFVNADYWSSATGIATLCGYHPYCGEVVIIAQNLIPLGVYTAWFVTEEGAYPAAPKNVTYTEDSFDPNRLIVNSLGQLQYYIAHLDYNPLLGYPVDNSLVPIQKVVLALHTDGRTWGIKPGPHFSHLVGSM